MSMAIGEAPTSGLTIAHLSSLESALHPAFVHAVALARTSQSRLVSLRANDDEVAESSIPSACDLLAKWGQLRPNALPGDESEFGMSHARVIDSTCDDVVDTLVAMVDRLRPDLLVAATNARTGIARALYGSISSAVSNELRIPSLLVPPAAEPFVTPERGELRVRRILVAAGDETTVLAGLAHAVWFIALTRAKNVEVELMHVGTDAHPDVPFLPPEGVRFSLTERTGVFEQEFVARARAWPADLIVMATRGHDTLRDVLFGTHTERVVSKAPCPVLSVPT